MFFVSVRYKIYEWSNLATFFSVLGAILKAFFWICMCFIVMLLVLIPTSPIPTYKDDLKFVIPIVLVVGIVLAIIGGLLQKKSVKISNIDFENKVKKDFQFVKRMAKKDLENKQWYIERNSQYADYVTSGKEALDVNDESYNDIKKVSPLRLALGTVMAIIFVFGGMYLLGSFN